MSWASGTDFIDWTLALMSGKLSREEEIEIWQKFILKLQNEDCDTIEEVLGQNHLLDEAWYRLKEKHD